MTEASVIDGAGAGVIEVDGRLMVNMASNDYLGFARDPRIIAAAHAVRQALGDSDCCPHGSSETCGVPASSG